MNSGNLPTERQTGKTKLILKLLTDFKIDIKAPTLNLTPLTDMKLVILPLSVAPLPKITLPTIPVVDVERVIINSQIREIFQEDENLTNALLDYVAKVPSHGPKLKNIANSLTGILTNKAQQRTKEPLIVTVYWFLDFMHRRLLFGEIFDAELLLIAENFYKPRLKELEGSYHINGREVGFLWEVIWGKQYEIHEMFFKIGMNFNLTNNHFGNTPLLNAISNAENDLAQHLLNLATKYPENKLDVNIISPVFGNAALHLVTAKGYRDISCHEPISNSNLKIAQLLIEHGADVNLPMECKSNPQLNGMTPLHLAALRRDFEFCELLIKQGAHLDVINQQKQTPLECILLDDDAAYLLIAAATTQMSCFRRYYDNNRSPQKLKEDLERYAAEVQKQGPKPLTLR